MRKIKDALKKTPLFKPLKTTYDSLYHIFFWNGWIRNYIIFPIKAFLRVHKVPPFFNDFKDIEKYKNKYEGERCFILCQGPSLTLEDCEKLAGEYTFGLNAFYRSYQDTDFRPSFYVSLDPDGEKLWSHSDNFNPENYAKIASFINMQSMHEPKYKNTIYVPVCYQNHFYSIFKPGFDYGKNCKMSDDLLWGLYDRYTVTTSVIDIAAYMGFKEIYLLGADNNYNGSKGHFNDKDGQGRFATKEQGTMTHNAMEAGYLFTEKATKERGIHVYNATRGGMLEAFDRVEFDSLKLKAPK